MVFELERLEQKKR